jgi:hypothetical protein
LISEKDPIVTFHSSTRAAIETPENLVMGMTGISQHSPSKRRSNGLVGQVAMKNHGPPRGITDRSTGLKGDYPQTTGKRQRK